MKVIKRKYVSGNRSLITCDRIVDDNITGPTIKILRGGTLKIKPRNFVARRSSLPTEEYV